MDVRGGEGGAYTMMTMINPIIQTRDIDIDTRPPPSLLTPPPLPQVWHESLSRKVLGSGYEGATKSWHDCPRALRIKRHDLKVSRQPQMTHADGTEVFVTVK